MELVELDVWERIIPRMPQIVQHNITLDLIVLTLLTL